MTVTISDNQFRIGCENLLAIQLAAWDMPAATGDKAVDAVTAAVARFRSAAVPEAAPGASSEALRELLAAIEAAGVKRYLAAAGPYILADLDR
ncbi:hypothetical protein [Rhizobium jaguaris]|uniref:Uncharacterized protein n=1 Tax=Rhizobium jaguaris TaxID=1312183 RepID=A0A387FNP4_9HYPH|nr:hypothetical protein [Rhizobium jaguaris]AYG60428.1 hypothetical protein CCGE525_17650 [Rhizobium jaguaris]